MVKPLINEIISFLNFLQENEGEPKKRRKVILLYSEDSKDNLDRIVSLCKDGGYIEEKHEEQIIKTREKKEGTKSIRETTFEPVRDTYRITIKGIQFLEENKKVEVRKKQQETQNHLTLGIFIVAFLQGMLLLFYNYFDLRARNFWEYALTYIIIGIATLIVALIITTKAGRQKND